MATTAHLVDRLDQPVDQHRGLHRRRSPASTNPVECAVVDGRDVHPVARYLPSGVFSRHRSPRAWFFRIPADLGPDQLGFDFVPRAPRAPVGPGSVRSVGFVGRDASAVAQGDPDRRGRHRPASRAAQRWAVHRLVHVVRASGRRAARLVSDRSADHQLRSPQPRRRPASTSLRSRWFRMYCWVASVAGWKSHGVNRPWRRAAFTTRLLC